MKILYQPWLRTKTINYSSKCKYDPMYAMGIYEVDDPETIHTILNDGHDVAFYKEGPLVMVMFPTTQAVPVCDKDNILSLHTEIQAIDYSVLDGVLYHFECGSYHYVIKKFDHDVDMFERSYCEDDIVFQVEHLLGHYMTKVDTYIFPAKPMDDTDYEYYDGTEMWTLLAAAYNDYKITPCLPYNGCLPVNMQELLDLFPDAKKYEGAIYTIPQVRYARNKNNVPVPVRITGYEQTKFAWKVCWTLLAYFYICEQHGQQFSLQQLWYTFIRILVMRLDNFTDWAMKNQSVKDKIDKAITYWWQSKTFEEFVVKHKPDRYGKIFKAGYILECAKEFVKNHQGMELTRNEIRLMAEEAGISPIAIWRAEKQLGIKLSTKRATRSDKGKGILETLTVQEIDGVKVVYYETYNASAKKACSRNGIRYLKKTA